MLASGPVIWVDPSAPSGYAVVDLRTGVFESGELEFFLLGEFLRRKMRAAAALGYEGFTIRPGTSRTTKSTDAPEVIGMLKWLAYYYNVPLLPVQQPDARSLGVKHLQAAGWHNPGKEDANAAAGHLLSYLITARLVPEVIMKNIIAQMEGTGV